MLSSVSEVFQNGNIQRIENELKEKIVAPIKELKDIKRQKITLVRR